MPEVAVIIVNLNAGGFIDRTLAALDAQTLRPARTIVVDNASTDGSADGLAERHPGVEVVRLDENVGFAAGNNAGVALVEGCEWVALLNPDAFAEPDWLETLVATAEARPEYSFFASRLVRANVPEELDGTGDILHVSGLAWRRDHGAAESGARLEPEEVFSACAAAALYSRDAFLAVGGLDERFFCYFEDTDLAFRLRLQGHRCLYVPGAVVHHVGSAISGAESDFTMYHSFRNLIWTWSKNMPRPLLWLYMPQFLLVNAMLLGAFVVRGRGGVILRAQRDAVRGLGPIRRERAVVQAGRQIGSKELRRALATGPHGYVKTFGRFWQRLYKRRRTTVAPKITEVPK